jgi:acetyl-CoA synthetase
MGEVTLKEIYPVPESFRKKAYVNSREQYDKMWKESVDDPNKFWGKIAEEYIDWFQKWDKVMDCKYGTSAKDLWVKWFVNAKVNVSYNCLDRHLAKRGDQVAIIWEGNEPTESKKITYKQLHEQVCKFANVLKKNGVKKGDVVTFYLPMIPELAIESACTRIGAIHSVVFGGFSAEAQGRVLDVTVKSSFPATEPSGARKPFPRKTMPTSASPSAPKSIFTSLSSALATRSSANGTTRLTDGGTTRWPKSTPTASPRRWTLKTPCSSCTLPVQPASPRALCTQRAAT